MSSVKTIEIKAKYFFEKIKNHDISMWDILKNMIDATQEQLVIFNDEAGNEIAHYLLPTTIQQLEADQAMFATYFKEKLQQDCN